MSPPLWLRFAATTMQRPFSELMLRHEDSVESVAFSPDGKQIVSGSRDKTARVWNADGSGTPLVFRGHADSVESVAFSP